MEEWDDDINMSDDERRIRDTQNSWAERARQSEAARQSRGYFNTERIPTDTIRENFEHYRDTEPRENSYNQWDYTAGKEVWICHNCGVFGYKYALHELFKCYCCKSRNITVCRAGELSMAIRTQNIGVNMTDVYSRRRERIRQARRERRRQ